MNEEKILKVVVSDFDISFGQIVLLMIKVVLASIPASIILGAIIFGLFLVFGGLLAALGALALYGG